MVGMEIRGTILGRLEVIVSMLLLVMVMIMVFDSGGDRDGGGGGCHINYDGCSDWRGSGGVIGGCGSCSAQGRQGGEAKGHCVQVFGS